MQYVSEDIAAWLSDYSSSRSVLPAYCVSAFWVVVELIWSHTDVVSQSSMQQSTRRSKTAVFSVRRFLGCYYDGTSIPKSSQDILCRATLKRPAAYSWRCAGLIAWQESNLQAALPAVSVAASTLFSVSKLSKNAVPETSREDST